MTSNGRIFGFLLLAFVVSSLLTSAIWLTAYFIGVKPNIKCDPDTNDKSILTKFPQQRTSIFSPQPTSSFEDIDPGPECTSPCKYELVESMPIGLYDGKDVKRFNSTADSWKKLMNLANETIYITSFYWSLLANDTGSKFTWDDSAQTGKEIYEQLIATGQRGVKIHINQDASSSSLGYPYYESKHLEEMGLAELSSLNFTRLVGNGVLHTKAWLIDNKHFYLGSANHDWRSLTQVKEIGITVYDCPCLANDLKKIFDVYAELGKPESSVPKEWPSKYATLFNSENPMELTMNNEHLSVYFTSSPPQFVPNGRENDGASIVRIIDEAERFVYISVMDYAPVTMFQKPNYYWPNIDDALRHAAFDRRMNVRLLMSNWQSTRPALFSYLHSLRALDSQLPCIKIYNSTTKKETCKPGTKGSIEIKLFQVPPYKIPIPFARVNHAKYMVTERTAVICTSNWSADYFINTGGISLVVHATDSGTSSKLIEDMQQLHKRDWFSEYATSIDEFNVMNSMYL